MNNQELVNKARFYANKSVRKSILNDIIEKNQFTKSVLFDSKLANSIDKINSANYFFEYNNDITLSKEIEWSLEMIKYHKNEISKYLTLKSEYEKLLYQGKYDKAKSTLDNINNISFSLWGIEQSFLLSELLGGFKTNKILLSEIGKITDNPIILLFSQIFSSKKSFSVSFRSYMNMINNHLKQTNDKVMKSYILFKFGLEIEDFKEINLIDVIFAENFMSIIDIYETTIKILIHCISFNFNDENLKKSDFLSYAIDIFGNIEDSRINKILICNLESYCKLENMDINHETLKVIDMYSNGDYKVCIEKIEEIIYNYEFSFELFEIYSKCHNYISDNNIENIKQQNIVIYEKILKPMISIVSCIDKNTSIEVLKNSSKIFDNSLTFSQLYYFIHRYKNNLKNNSKREIAQYYSNYINPNIVLIVKSKKIKKRILDILYNDKTSSTYCIYSSYVNNDKEKLTSCNIPSVNRKYLEARLERNLNKRLKILKSILDDNDSLSIIIKEKILVCLFYTFLNLKDINNSIRIIVDSYIVNSDLISRMILCENYKTKRFIDDIAVDNLSKAIFTFILNKNDFSTIYIYIANYLDQYEVRTASELLDLNGFVIDNKVEFVLSRLYTKDVMKRIVYLLPDQRNLERIKILHKLKDMQYSDSKIYDDEIEQILKEESIKTRLIQVEQTKIFVDTKSLITENEQHYLQSFQNMITLDIPDLDFVNISKYENELALINKKLELLGKSEKVSQKYIIFRELYFDFLRSFLYDHKFGLEKFLSSRIRHGHLENNLLRTIKNYNLLSESTFENPNVYNINNYWKTQFKQSSNKQLEKLILEYLSQFSKAIIEKVKNVKEWISVFDDIHPFGLFNYDRFLTDNVAQILFASLENNYDFSIFFNELISFIWQITEDMLEEIREKLENELYSFYIFQLDELYNKVSSNIIDCELKKIFLSQINLCKSNVRSDIDNVNNWLNVRKSNDYIDFELLDAIEACITMQEKLDSSISKISIKKNNITNITINGEFFNYFFDIINLLLSNSIHHSGFDNTMDMLIEIEATTMSWLQSYEYLEQISKEIASEWNRLTDQDIANPLLFKIKNKLSANLDLDVVHEKLNDSLTKLKNLDVSKEYISKEGNSGIIKINSILKYNIPTPCYNIFYNIDEQNLIIEAVIVIDIGKIAIQKVNNEHFSC